MNKLSLVLLAVMGCGDVVDTAEVVPIARLCPEWGCGHNTAVGPDGVVFDEFDSRGFEPNRGGAKLVKAKLASGEPVRIGADRHWLVATSLIDGTVYREAWDLVGLVATVEHPVFGRYELLVASIDESSMAFWTDIPPMPTPAPPAMLEEVPFYEIKVRRLGDPQPFKLHICVDDTLASDPQWMGVARKALIFQWDRYDPVNKTVAQTSLDDPWFNIACAATYPAKMHLQRHTHAGNFITTISPSDGGRVHTQVHAVDEGRRNAMLKTLTADYCGDGRSYTEHGVRLHWEEAYFGYRSTTDVIGAPLVELEAIWGPGGALCLGTPRRADPAEITCAATRPVCTPVWHWFWRWFGYVISAKLP